MKEFNFKMLHGILSCGANLHKWKIRNSSVCDVCDQDQTILPLDVDSINENDSVANPDPTPRIASVHKSRFAEVVLVGCWMEAVYYCLLLRRSKR